MSDKISSLLDAEQEMTKAIQKIDATLADLEKFKAASDALSDIYTKNHELLKGLREVAERLQEGAKHLGEEGVAGFKDALAGGLVDSASKTTSALEAFEEKVGKVLVETNDAIGKALEATQEKLAQGEARDLAARKKISTLTVIVIVLGVLQLAAAGVLAFKLFGS
jgi:hypothetical protein